MSYILSFDIGTTSTRALLFDKDFIIAGIEQEEISQFYPALNCVEQSPEELLDKTINAAQRLLKKTNICPSDIAAIGITNQRETTIVWDKKSGKAICNAIVWQDKRTSSFCQELKNNNFEKLISQKTGL
ncbi:MAG: FGGY family carbohydrate kinase, partial [Bacteroidales bacterium]|nr:FGGY family carbohydrate kinase [Bacteroidales bacterium]